MTHNDKYWPPRAIDINEDQEWIEVPMEEVLPKWLVEALQDDEDDEEMEFAFICPYLKDGFKDWLKESRKLSSKYVDEYLRAYTTAYDSLYKEVGIDLFAKLQSIFEEPLDGTECNLNGNYIQSYTRLRWAKVMK